MTTDQRIADLQTRTGLGFWRSYTDKDHDGDEFTVVEFGDPPEGRAFIIYPDGRFEEVDR